MTAKIRRRPSRRAHIALLASLVYLALAVVAPIAHGRAGVLQSARTVESGHSDQCAVIHVEAACVLRGLAQIRGTTARDLRLTDGSTRRITAGLPDIPSTGSDISLTHPARAPPSH